MQRAHISGHRVERSRPTHQTPDVEPMLASCWTSVADVNQTLNQYWVNVSRVFFCLVVCFLGVDTTPKTTNICTTCVQRRPNATPSTLVQPCTNVVEIFCVYWVVSTPQQTQDAVGQRLVIAGCDLLYVSNELQALFIAAS